MDGSSILSLKSGVYPGNFMILELAIKLAACIKQEAENADLE